MLPTIHFDTITTISEVLSVDKMANRGNFLSGLSLFLFVFLGVHFPAEAAVKKYQFDVSF